VNSIGISNVNTTDIFKDVTKTGYLLNIKNAYLSFIVFESIESSILYTIQALLTEENVISDIIRKNEFNVDKDEKFIKDSNTLKIYKTKTIPEDFPKLTDKVDKKKFQKIPIEAVYPSLENPDIKKAIAQSKNKNSNKKSEFLKKNTLFTWLN